VNQPPLTDAQSSKCDSVEANTEWEKKAEKAGREMAEKASEEKKLVADSLAYHKYNPNVSKP
jgi:hypothetical protein